MLAFLLQSSAPLFWGHSSRRGMSSLAFADVLHHANQPVLTGIEIDRNVPAGTLHRGRTPRRAGLNAKSGAGRPWSPIRGARERCRRASARHPMPAVIVAGSAGQSSLYGDSRIAVSLNPSRTHPGNQLRCRSCLTRHRNGPVPRRLGASLASAGGPAVQL